MVKRRRRRREEEIGGSVVLAGEGRWEVEMEEATFFSVRHGGSLGFKDKEGVLCMIFSLSSRRVC